MIRLVIFISCSHYVALLSLLLLQVVSFFFSAAQKPCIVLHPKLQECFHLRKLPTSAARVNCWNNSTTSKSQQLKIRRYITASGLNFHSSCLLCHLPSLHAWRNGAVWHDWGFREGWCKCEGIDVHAVQSSFSEPGFLGGRQRPFFQNMSTQSDEKNTHYHCARPFWG